MNELKTVVGILRGKKEGDGWIEAEIDCGGKYPLKIKGWIHVSKTDSTLTPIAAELEGVKVGMKVSATYAEKPGTWNDKPVTYRNLFSIAIATDATPLTAPAQSDGQKTAPHAEKREYESVEEKRRAICYTSCFNNAVVLYAPLLMADYQAGRPLDSDEIDRHIKNITALAEGLFDPLWINIHGIK